MTSYTLSCKGNPNVKYKFTFGGKILGLYIYIYMCVCVCVCVCVFSNVPNIQQIIHNAVKCKMQKPPNDVLHVHTNK